MLLPQLTNRKKVNNIDSFTDKLNSVVNSPEEVQISKQTIQEYKGKYCVSVWTNEFCRIIKERMEQKAKCGEYSLIDNKRHIFVEVNSQEVFIENKYSDIRDILYSSPGFCASETVSVEKAHGIFHAKGTEKVARKYSPTEFLNNVGNAVVSMCIKENIQCEVKLFVIDPLTKTPTYKDCESFTYTGKWGWYSDPYIGLGIIATITF